MTSRTLLADIGGTNARFALLENGQIIAVHKYACARFENLRDAVTAYQAETGAKTNGALFSIASPLAGDYVQMTNHHWGFSVEAERVHFGWNTFRVVNDFYAVAAAVTPIVKAWQSAPDASVLRVVKQGTPMDDEPMAVLGPGSGLGMAYVTCDAGKPTPHATEGGHVTMPAQTPREFAVFQTIMTLNPHYSHLSAERVVCGKGLLNIYKAIGALENKPTPFDDPEAVSGAALKNQCPLAVEAVDLFCYLLGVVAGNQALTLGAKGGVFIAGGIVPKLGDAFFTSRFHDGFLNKGRFRAYLEPIPVYLMTHPDPAFEGLRAVA